MAKFRGMKTLQKFAAVHASIHNHFNNDRHLNRLSNSVRSFEPRPRRRALRHNQVTRDRQGHAWRRIERCLEPFQHRLRIERLIGDPAGDDPGWINPRIAHYRLRVGGKRIT